MRRVFVCSIERNKSTSYHRQKEKKLVRLSVVAIVLRH